MKKKLWYSKTNYFVLSYSTNKLILTFFYKCKSSRAIQLIEISRKHLGKATDSCFKILMNENEAVAIRAFAMSVIFNISEKEPDIKNELKICIQ